MKVKFLTGMAGHKHVWNPGEIHDVPEAEAKRLLKAGYVEAVGGGSAVERRRPTETAVNRKAGAEKAGKGLIAQAKDALSGKKPAAKKPGSRK